MFLGEMHRHMSHEEEHGLLQAKKDPSNSPQANNLAAAKKVFLLF